MELIIYTAKHRIKMDSEDLDLRKVPRTGKPRCLSLTEKGYVRFSCYYAKGKAARLHRLIMERVVGRSLLKTEQVDHINGDRCDNRRCNLRVVTSRQNNQNRTKHRDGRLVGCRYDERCRRWQARIRIKGKRLYLGLFNTEQQAHEAYLTALRKEGFV